MPLATENVCAAVQVCARLSSATMPVLAGNVAMVPAPATAVASSKVLPEVAPSSDKSPLVKLCTPDQVLACPSAKDATDAPEVGLIVSEPSLLVIEVTTPL